MTILKKISNAATKVALYGGIGLMGLSAVGGVASAQSLDMSSYQSNQAPLNNSPVHGHARLSFSGTDLQINLRASGLIPGMLHPAHIHGMLNGTNASCPTFANDANGDGYVSVFEGAPAYGPIKLNLTSPQTAFGAPANATLFAPFAGVPNLANFPQVGKNKQFVLNQTYVFNLSNSYDSQAYTSLRALQNQHIVIHGAYAPQSVDTAGGGSQIVYDPLLPVACGEIRLIGGSDGQPAKVELHMQSVNPQITSDGSAVKANDTDSEATVSISTNDQKTTTDTTSSTTTSTTTTDTSATMDMSMTRDATMPAMHGAMHAGHKNN